MKLFTEEEMKKLLEEFPYLEEADILFIRTVKSKNGKHWKEVAAEMNKWAKENQDGSETQ